MDDDRVHGTPWDLPLTTSEGIHLQQHQRADTAHGMAAPPSDYPRAAAAGGEAHHRYADHVSWQSTGQGHQQQQQQHHQHQHPYYMSDGAYRSSSPGVLLGGGGGGIGFLPPSPTSRPIETDGMPYIPPALPHFTATSRSIAFGTLPPAVHGLPLSSHAFPPTVSPEQHASLSAAVAAAHPRTQHQHARVAPTYGSNPSAPMPVRQSSGGASSRSGGRYHSPGTTPTQVSSRPMHHSSTSGADTMLGRSMTPPSSLPHQAESLLVGSYDSTVSPSRVQSGSTSMHPTPPIPSARRSTSRSSVMLSAGGSMEGPGAILLPIRRGSTNGSTTPASGGGLKRKAHSVHSLLELAPPLPLHSASNSDDDTPPEAVTAAPAPTSKKGMGRKSRSETSLTAAERKQNRLKRKAELARVSRRKKKGHLEETKARIDELREAIAAMEGRDPSALAPDSIISPSASFSNLALCHSSSTGSMHSPNKAAATIAAANSRRSSRAESQSHKRARRDSAAGDESDEDDSQDEDDSGEDDEDESHSSGHDDEEAEAEAEEAAAAANAAAAAAAGAQSRMPSRTPQLHSSTSAPHLSHLQQYTQQVRSPPVLSQQTSSGTPPIPQDDASTGAFNMSVFLPRVVPCPPVPPGANDVVSGTMMAGGGGVNGGPSTSLVQLHRHLQDALKAVDVSLQLDPFEKLLRWVAQQASSPPSDTTASPAAAAQANAWAFLAQQLELTSAQVAALRQSRAQTDRLGTDIAGLRSELVRVSSGVRSYMSTLDGLQQQMQLAALHPTQIDRLSRWMQSNQQWLLTQMQAPMPSQPPHQQAQQQMAHQRHLIVQQQTQTHMPWQQKQQQQQQQQQQHHHQHPHPSQHLPPHHFPLHPPPASSSPHYPHPAPIVSMPRASPAHVSSFPSPSPSPSLMSSPGLGPAVFPTPSPTAGHTRSDSDASHTGALGYTHNDNEGNSPLLSATAVALLPSQSQLLLSPPASPPIISPLVPSMSLGSPPQMQMGVFGDVPGFQLAAPTTQGLAFSDSTFVSDADLFAADQP